MSFDPRRLVERFPAVAGLDLGRRRSRRLPFVQQTTSVDCGAACLAMVLGYHGRKASLDEVRERSGAGREGSNAQILLETARRYGLRARAVRVHEIERLRLLPPASILHWKFEHFVVLARTFADGGGEIVDPAVGRRRVSAAELDRSFTGVALVLEPTPDFEPGGSDRSGVRRYLASILSHRDLWSRVVVLSVLLQLLALAVPLLTGLIVDQVVPRDDRHLLTVLSVGLVGLLGFAFLSSFLRAHLLLHLRTRLDSQLTLDFLDHLIDLPFAFFQRRTVGDLIMRLNSNTQIREVLTSSALSGLLDGAFVSFYLVLLLLAHPGMALLVLVLGFLRVGIFLVTRKKYRELMAARLSTEAQSRNYQVQILAGIETLKGLGAERRASRNWSALFVDELNVSLEQGRLAALVDSLLQTLATGSPLVILAYGAHLVMTGQLSLGMMLALAALAAGFLNPLGTLTETALRLQQLGGYLDRIDDVLASPREQDQDEELLPAPPLSGRIRVEDLSFRYSDRSPLVVDRVSLEIEPGSFVALVGPSGAGKTTLANLLLGLYRPTSGSISYDGHDLAHLDVATVRQQMGMVTQQPYLFGASVRENISLADPSRPLDEIVAVARQAHIHREIMAMPMGYEAILADGGASLSGGQRQRLALARALLRRPAVLLLDEATSNLDAVSERAIQGELARLDATRIVIAHRLSTILEADVILVMDGGRIVQQGTHDDLVAADGPYRRLIGAQLDGRSELEEVP